MNFGSWLFSLHSAAISPTSFWISLLVFAAVSLLCVAGLRFFGLSARSASMMSGKPALTGTSQSLKVQRALAHLRFAGPRLAILAGVFLSGWWAHDSRDYSNTFVVVNAVVNSQDGRFLTYHLEDDPLRTSYTTLFCEVPKQRMPHLEPRQIIAAMVLVREEHCERVNSLRLRRINGRPILEGGL